MLPGVVVIECYVEERITVIPTQRVNLALGAEGREEDEMAPLRRREEDAAELKVRAGDSIEGDKKLKCLAISGIKGKDARQRAIEYSLMHYQT